MGGRHKKIAIELGHIHRKMGQALAGIHQQQGPCRMGQGRNRFDRIEAAQGVAHLHQAHQFGAPIDLAAEILEIQFTGLGEAGMAQHATRTRRQQLPGHQVAVVLHHREQNLIARLEVGLAPATGHQVDGLTGIAGEHNLPGAGRTDEGRRLAPGSLKTFGGSGTQLVGAAVHVGVVVGVVVLQGLKHLEGLLAGGRVIEIDQGLAQASGLGQKREIRPGDRRQIDGSLRCKLFA